jgi:hypothetical protein
VPARTLRPQQPGPSGELELEMHFLVFVCQLVAYSEPELLQLSTSEQPPRCVQITGKPWMLPFHAPASHMHPLFALVCFNRSWKLIDVNGCDSYASQHKSLSTQLQQHCSTAAVPTTGR